MANRQNRTYTRESWRSGNGHWHRLEITSYEPEQPTRRWVAPLLKLTFWLCFWPVALPIVATVQAVKLMRRSTRRPAEPIQRIHKVVQR